MLLEAEARDNMGHKDSTKQRYTIIRSKIFNLSTRFFRERKNNYVELAIKEIAKETGYAERTLKNIYYRE
jgi:hypothetical protein